jgi:hypothetical protein
MPPEPRLATHVLVSSLIRRASADGDFATILRKGDPTAGALLLAGRVRGQNLALYEQYPTLEGSRNWQPLSEQAIDSEEKLAEYLKRRIARDPDIWILELDVAFPERLAGLLASGT